MEATGDVPTADEEASTDSGYLVQPSADWVQVLMPDPRAAMNALRHVDHLKNFEDAVLPSMVEGIRSIKYLSTILLSVDPTSIESEYEYIKRAIEEAKDNLDSAEEAASIELEAINSYSEKLTLDKSNLQKEKERKTTELANFNVQLAANRELLQTNRNQLEIARKNMQEKQHELDRMHEKMKEAERNRNIGIGLMFIPFIGPVVGGAMIAVSQVDYDNAKGAAKTAKRVLGDAEANFSAYSQRVSSYEAQVRQASDDIRNTGTQLVKVDSDIQEASQMCSVLADVQQIFRNATHILGEIDGSASVMEVQTKCVIYLEPLVMNLADIVQKMSKISGNDEKYRILQVNDIAPLITYLHDNLPKLKAICDQENLDY